MWIFLKSLNNLSIFFMVTNKFPRNIVYITISSSLNVLLELRTLTAYVYILEIPVLYI